MSHRATADLLIAGLLAGVAGFLLGRWSAVGGHAEPCDDDEIDLDISIGNQSLKSEEPAMISKDLVKGDGPCSFTVRPTHRGRPVKLDGPVTVEVADPTLVSAAVEPDGVTVMFEDVAEGPLGATTATISGDTRQGPEVITKTVIVGLNVVAAESDTDELPGDFGDQGGGTPAPTEPMPPTETPSAP
jgi:hypothetical protein